MLWEIIDETIPTVASSTSCFSRHQGISQSIATLECLPLGKHNMEKCTPILDISGQPRTMKEKQYY
jgi:hypothetical protein